MHFRIYFGDFSEGCDVSIIPFNRRGGECDYRSSELNCGDDNCVIRGRWDVKLDFKRGRLLAKFNRTARLRPGASRQN